MDDAIVSQLTEMMDEDGYINPEPVESDEDEDEVDTPEVPESEEQDEVDPETDPEEESEEEAPEETPEEDQLFDITIGDEEYEVNLEELKTGYLRQEDLVQRRTALEAEHTERLMELEQTREELRKELEHISVFALGNANRYDQVNWAELKKNDPAKYQELRAEAFDAKEQADALARRRNDIQRMSAEAARIRHEAKVKSQLGLAKELIPEFTSDPDFAKKLVAYGKQLGYTEDEVSAIDDARQLAVLNQARLYAESQVRKKAAVELKVTKELPPALKPGAPKPSNAEATQKTKLARQRLGSEKSVDAAAAYFLSSGMI
jgi:hypothetical protein